MSHNIPNGPWFHGGSPGLMVGDILRPRSATGVQGWSEHAFEFEHVFVTPFIEVATLYAAGYTSQENGAVYQVTPIGELVPDPHLWGLLSHQQFLCGGARIVSVEHERVSLGDVVSAELAIWKKYQAPALRRDIDRLRKWWTGDSQVKAPMVNA